MAITRHDMKKDELNDLVLTVVYWIKNNRTMFFNIVGIVAGIAIFTTFFLVRYHTLSLRGIDKLSIAQSIFFQGDAQKAIPMLEELIRSYPDSEISTQARLTLAGIYFDQMNLQKAEETIKPNTENSKPKSMMPLSLSELGTIQENAQKFSEAVKTYNQFVNNFPEHFLTPKIYESLGRVYELSNSLAEAKSTYEKLVALYPSSPWAQRAQERIDMINLSSQPRK
jgi:TolA-binding protein